MVYNYYNSRDSLAASNVKHLFPKVFLIASSGFPPLPFRWFRYCDKFLSGSLLSVSSKIYLFPFFVLVFFFFFLLVFENFFLLSCRAIISAGLTPLYGLFNVLQFSKYSKKWQVRMVSQQATYPKNGNISNMNLYFSLFFCARPFNAR